MLPGIVLAVGLVYIVSRRYRADDLSHVKRASRADIIRALIIALPSLALPLVIRTAVVKGIATATEVSTIGIVYAFIVGTLVYRRMDWRRLGPILVDTASLSGAILIIIGAASGMAWGLTQSGFSRSLAVAMTHLPGGAIGFMAVSIVAFIVLGSVLEGIPAIVLFGPLLFPIAHAVGINEVHYAMVVVLAMGLGPLRAAVWRRLLRSLRDRQGQSLRRDPADPGLYGSPRRGASSWVAAVPWTLDRLSLTTGPGLAKER